MTHHAQPVNPQPTPPAASLTVHGRDVTVHDLYRTTGTFQTFVHDITVNEDGHTLARYEVIEKAGRLTCARTAGRWDTPDAAYADLAAHAVQMDAAVTTAIVKRLTDTEWLCVLPGACLTGTLHGQTLTIRDQEDVLAVHTIELRKTGANRYRVPGVGAWGGSLAAIRDLLQRSALPYLSGGLAA